MSLYRRPNSPHYWVRFQINGREVRLSSGTEDRRAAEEFEAHARSSAWRQVKLGEAAPYPWTAATKRWLAETTKRTKEKDKTIIAWLDTHLVGENVQDVTREVVDELRALKAEETSQANADRYMCLLRALLKKCVDDWGVLTSAPKVPMYRAAVPEPKWLTRKEFEKLCSKLPKHLELAARFAVTTGLRMRSMTALTWERIDMKSKRLWVPGSQMKGKSAIGLPLSTEALRLLKELKALNPDGEHVFQWKGEPIDDCNTKAFQDAVTAAGLGPLRWHDLRHTFASWAVQAGVTLQELMQLGGWKSFSMVLRYAHLAPDHLAAAAEKVSKVGKPSHKKRHTVKSSGEARVSP